MSAEALLKNPNGRQHERTKLKARLKLIHHTMGEATVFTADLSDGGLFILRGDGELPDVGEIIQLQVQDVPVEAPVLRAKIVRKNTDGVGVMFVDRNN